MAPTKDSSPPASQTETIAVAFGSSCAINTGVKNIPPPMTFDTTMDAASTAPRLRWRAGSLAMMEQGAHPPKA